MKYDDIKKRLKTLESVVGAGSVGVLPNAGIGMGLRRNGFRRPSTGTTLNDDTKLGRDIWLEIRDLLIEIRDLLKKINKLEKNEHIEEKEEKYE